MVEGESAKEEEMFILAAGFAAQMRKRSAPTTTNYKISYKIFGYENDFVHKYILLGMKLKICLQK